MTDINVNYIAPIYVISIIIAVGFGFLAGYIKYYIEHKPVENKEIKEELDKVIKSI